MAILVTIQDESTSHVNNSMRQFGTTTLPTKRLKDIKFIHRKSERQYYCKLTEVIILLKFRITINRKKLTKKKSCFNLDTRRTVHCKKNADGDWEPKKDNHRKLDEQNVMAHEMQHVKDVTDTLKSAVQDALDRQEPDLGFPCNCTREQCKRQLLGLIQNRVNAILNRSYATMLSHRNGQTETNARNAQVDEFNDR